MNQDRTAAIVGIHEYPLRVAPGVSAMQIKVDSIRAALADAGLQWSDVDAIYDAGDGEAAGGLQLCSYLGLKPSVIDTTYVGGSSFEFRAGMHALRDIAAGLLVRSGCIELRCHIRFAPYRYWHRRP